MSTPKTNTALIEVWYYRSWGAMHILLGILCSIIFVMGALILHNQSHLTYLLLSFGIIYMGYVRIRKPYLRCFDKKITVTGLLGNTSYEYIWEYDKDLVIKGNRLYLNNKKLKFNYWFTNQNQYQNMIRFYTKSKSLIDELQD